MSMEDLINNVIDERYYQLMKAQAENSNDDTFLKLVEATRAVSKKHGYNFKELFDMSVEISMMLQTKE